MADDGQRASANFSHLNREHDPAWNFAQSLAWVAWRSEAAVALCAPWQIEPFFAADLLRGDADPIPFLGPPPVRMPDASSLLIAKLASGEIRALPFDHGGKTTDPDIIDVDGAVADRFWLNFWDARKWHGDDLLTSILPTMTRAGTHVVPGVRIYEEVLKHHFPALIATTMTRSPTTIISGSDVGSTTTDVKLTPTEVLIEKAVTSLWPAGVPDFRTKKIRDKLIFDRLIEQGLEEKHLPSEVSVRRYFKKVSPGRSPR